MVFLVRGKGELGHERYDGRVFEREKVQRGITNKWYVKRRSTSNVPPSVPSDNSEFSLGLALDRPQLSGSFFSFAQLELVAISFPQ
jgi:hypothetical protein